MKNEFLSRYLVLSGLALTISLESCASVNTNEIHLSDTRISNDYPSLQRFEIESFSSREIYTSLLSIGGKGIVYLPTRRLFLFATSRQGRKGLMIKDVTVNYSRTRMNVITYEDCGSNGPNGSLDSVALDDCSIEESQDGKPEIRNTRLDSSERQHDYEDILEIIGSEQISRLD